MSKRIYPFACALITLQGSCPSAVLEVGQDKPYRTISPAVREACAGDAILVYPGVYVEPPLALKEGCTLAGAGPGKAVVTPDLWLPFGRILCPAQGTIVRGLWLGGAQHGAIVGSPGCSFHVQDCVMWGNGTAVQGQGSGDAISLTNCTIWGNDEGVVCKGGASAILLNTIVHGNTSNLLGEVENVCANYSCIEGGWPGEGNVDGDPLLLNPEKWDWDQFMASPQTYALTGHFRLRADSPCIDAGFNSPDLPQTDIVGMHRIMFGGKSLTVDMGAYEFYINKLDPIPGMAVLTWSSLSEKTYSIFYSHDLLDWHTAIANFPSSGNQTTSWTDDGSLTGIAPLLAPKRFYRLLENP